MTQAPDHDVPARVQYRKGRRLPPGTVYVGRTRNGYEPYGNPFRAGHAHPFQPELGLVTGRAHAVDLYAAWLPTQPHLCERVVRELAGRDLACWCPLDDGPCHGAVLLALANTRLPALTEQQPWAWAISRGGKHVENRTWGPPASLIGRRLAIHGGRSWWPGWRTHQPLQTAWAEFRARQPVDPGPLGPGAAFCDEGAIVALATVVGAHPARGGCCAPWGEPSFALPGKGEVTVHHWVLEQIQPLPEPLTCRGKQMLWTPSPAVLAALLFPAAGGQR
jgi:hypothetical protein